MRGGAGFAVYGVVFGDLRRPVAALPVDQVRGQAAAVVLQALPPHVAVVRQRDIGKYRVFVQAQHAVRVGQHVGAGGHAEVARLGVDRVQAAIGVGLDPGDVVANGGDFPAFKTSGRHQHREIGFAASAGESGGDVVLFALWVTDAQDQHVLGQPAFVFAHGGRNAQREALFAQQRVATVAGAVAPNFAGLGVMNDVFGLVARPFHVGLARLQWRADGVYARHEGAIHAQHVVHRLAHAGHDFHVDGDIRAV